MNESQTHPARHPLAPPGLSDGSNPNRLEEPTGVTTGTSNMHALEEHAAVKLNTLRGAHGALSSVRRVFYRTTALPMLSNYQPAIVTRQVLPGRAGHTDKSL